MKSTTRQTHIVTPPLQVRDAQATNSGGRNEMTDLYPSRREAAPRILPRLDPVVHSSWDERAPVTRAQAEQFDRDGYLVLDEVFSAAEVAALQTSAAKLLADPAALEDETV